MPGKLPKDLQLDLNRQEAISQNEFNRQLGVLSGLSKQDMQQYDVGYSYDRNVRDDEFGHQVCGFFQFLQLFILDLTLTFSIPRPQNILLKLQFF